MKIMATPTLTIGTLLDTCATPSMSRSNFAMRDEDCRTHPVTAFCKETLGEYDGYRNDGESDAGGDGVGVRVVYIAAMGHERVPLREDDGDRMHAEKPEGDGDETLDY